uniref:indolepyruvate ferredoxin oxidoreductase family protein n=1 Tax=Immundisolibacter sp. TaxID=1934948 RepID=UPI00356AAD25
MSLLPVTLEDKYAQPHGRVLVSATQALTRLLLEQRTRDLAAGCNTAGYVSGYRGSPLGTLDKALWSAEKHLTEHHVVFRAGVNEDLAATAIWGTQQLAVFEGARYDGVFAMWYGKGPGVERSGDALHHANLAGTSPHGGVLMAVGDDPVCHSSTVPQQSEFALMAAGIPVLAAANIQDVYDFGLAGIAISRFSGVWVALKLVTDVAESSAVIDLDSAASRLVLPADFVMPPDGVHLRVPDWPTFQEERLMRYRLPAVQAAVRASGLDRVTLTSPQPRLGIVAFGKAYEDLRQGLLDLGLDDRTAAQLGITLYKPALIWPLEPQGLRAFAAGLEEVLVVEEGRAMLEGQIKDLLFALPDGQRPRVVGKLDEAGRVLFSDFGELSPRAVARVLARRLAPMTPDAGIDTRLSLLEGQRERASRYQAKFQRTPYFCSGCPHNTGTRIPDGSVALAGIGCHFLAQRMERNTKTWTHMGAEGVSWVGMAPFTDLEHVFVNIGDGTYYHSGLLAIRQAVASGVNVTYKILYNDATAMTGGQPIDGPISVVQITHQMHGESVQRIAVVSDAPEKFNRRDFAEGTTLDHRDQLDAVQRELRECPGTSVLIYEQTCGTEKRRRRKRGKLADPDKRAFINDRVCEGCGDCSVKSNCLSVVPLETEFGRKRAIDQSACNKDYSCVKGFCPSFVTVHGGGLARPRGNQVPEALLQGLAEPTRPEAQSAYGMLVAGVGGMGVVTVSQLLATAAHMEGRYVLVLDDTGLSQKFGSVFSHVQIAASAEALHTGRVGDGNADLLLGPDLVTCASEKVLAKTSTGRTNAVVNTYEQMTGDFTRQPDLTLPSVDLKHAVSEFCGDGRVHFVDATRLSRELIGDAIGANMFLLGYAYQRGLVPLSAASIERAITLNGVSVNGNVNIFRWGRLYAEQPRQVEDIAASSRGPKTSAPLSHDLASLVNRRVADLTAYQNAAYAEGYRSLVERVRQAEKSKTKGMSGLAEAVATNFYKLLAYKDEYEVARLYTDGEFLAKLRESFAGDYRLRFHLAPPLLARRDPISGQLQKREYGGWMLPVLKALAHLKFLRGGVFDVFGYTAERRMERRLIGDYQKTMETVLAGLDHENHALALEIA